MAMVPSRGHSSWRAAETGLLFSPWGWDREEKPGGQRLVPGDASLEPVQPVGVSDLPPEPWTGQRGEGPWAEAEGSAEKTQ